MSTSQAKRIERLEEELIKHETMMEQRQVQPMFIKYHVQPQTSNTNVNFTTYFVPVLIERYIMLVTPDISKKRCYSGAGNLAHPG